VDFRRHVNVPGFEAVRVGFKALKRMGFMNGDLKVLLVGINVQRITMGCRKIGQKKSK